MDARRGIALAASSRPGAAADQHPARPRRGRAFGPALSPTRGAGRGRHHRDANPRPCWLARGSARPAPSLVAARAGVFRQAAGDGGALAGCAGAAPHGRGLSRILDRLVRAASSLRASRVSLGKPKLLDRAALRPHFLIRHDGNASMSSAPALPGSPPRPARRRGADVVLHEATAVPAVAAGPISMQRSA